MFLSKSKSTDNKASAPKVESCPARIESDEEPEDIAASVTDRGEGSTGVDETVEEESDVKMMIVETEDSGDTLKDDATEDLEAIPLQDEEECSQAFAKVAEKQCGAIPICKILNVQKPSHVAVPRKRPPISTPDLSAPPLILACHLVPSLPISLFEVLIEAIEIATGRAVVFLYESRSDRPVANHIVDIAILPASGEWADGNLLPVSFVFEHRLNRDKSPHIYADVVVASDCAPHVEDVMDLRGHRCALPDRRKQVGVASLLYEHLRSKGESPAFFGNTLDAESHLAALQMAAGKQAEVGILEAPVITYHKNNLPGVESLHILTSMGPLPPYRIMVHKALPDALVAKITAYLLNINDDVEWLESLTAFGVIGFAKNCIDFYSLNDMKSVVTSVPYY